MDDQTANERLARLLGWRPRRYIVPDMWFETELETTTPDFLNDWQRFPELQAYVRGLDELTRFAIVDTIYGKTGETTATRYQHITPRILGMSILEVCGSDD